MSQLAHAYSFAKKGFHVFPLRENSKNPLIKSWPQEATTDPKKIKNWWIDPILEVEQPYNLGISTSRFNGSEFLVAIDVDNKGDKKGDDELLNLEMQGLDIPQTLEQITPTGGRHLIYRCKVPLRQGVNKLGPGLDIRAKGGYLVGAGSILGDKEYALIEREVAEAPDWLVELLKRPIEKEKPKKSVVSINEETALHRAKEYLKKAPVSVEGDGGNETAYKVICFLKDFGLSAESCLDLLLKDWNEDCQPPWSAEDLEVLVANAYRYGVHEIGSSSPEFEFQNQAIEKPKGEESKHFLEKINDSFALVFEEGGHTILYETIDEKGRKVHKFYTEGEFRRKFSTESVDIGGEKPVKVANLWLDWPKRREYQGLAFAPGREAKNGYYNLFKGWDVEPLDPKEATEEQKEAFDLFINHIEENLCLGDKSLATWFLGYLAHIFQKPYERPLVTIVIKGLKGTGKNFIFDRVGSLFSRYYKVAHDPRYLTSNFNGHLDSCLMLILDEAFWSGDKRVEGKLKGLTTAPEIFIERKGKEPYMVDNLVRLVIIGNEDWLVNATVDERRYAVFQMGDAKRSDLPYFDKIAKGFKNGADRILLHYLLHFDLSKVNVNSAPLTDALIDQKQESLDPFERFWSDCLYEGKIVHSHFGNKWPSSVLKDSFRDAFFAYTKARNIRTWLSDSRQIGRKLLKLCPSVDHKNKRRIEGEKGPEYLNEYRFPNLEQARSEWEKAFGGKVDWE